MNERMRCLLCRWMNGRIRYLCRMDDTVGRMLRLERRRSFEMCSKLIAGKVVADTEQRKRIVLETHQFDVGI